MRIRPLRPEERGRYAEWVGVHPDATLYHSMGWLEVLAAGFGYRPYTLVAWSGADIEGALPLVHARSLAGGRRLVSLPFSHRVAPLGSAETRRALIEAARQAVSETRSDFVELRCQVDQADWVRQSTYVNTVAALPGDETGLRACLRANTRQELQQALRNPELQAVQVRTLPVMRRFARLLLLTRRRKGSLTYPWAFYVALLERLVLSGKALFELATWRGLDIAALATFAHGTSAIYAYSASVEDPELLRLRPTNLLLWRGMDWARRSGATTFDLGTSLHAQKGLVYFKEGWGGKTEPLHYSQWVRPGRRGRAIRQDSPLMRQAETLLRRLPEPVFAFLTPRILRAVG